MASLSVNPSASFTRRTASWLFNKLPEWEVPKGKVLNAIKWSGQHISSPQNRLILGVTALMSQPFIDLHNRNVDDETRKVSAARTTAKILAGMTTGFLVRYYTIKAVEAFTKNPAKAQKTLESLMFPKGIAHTTIKGMQQYKLALGTYISIGIMLFTNFAIDAPLTKFLTNIFVKKIKDNEKNKIDSILIAQTNNNLKSEHTDLNECIKRPTMDSFTRNNRKEAK